MGDLDAYVAQRVEVHGGRVVKQTGDGHLVAFDLPRNALRAACEIALGVHVLGVEVRCGLHTGEVELLPDGDLGGIAVHAAARVCDAAGPHQVLVSRTVADLAAGSDFRFEDRGPTSSGACLGRGHSTRSSSEATPPTADFRLQQIRGLCRSR